ncbi:regulatory protein [Aquipluma nitroreducens]|uniref:Regulatory protein RecX n=1 Tax=Aquipluma nitroreducens TaxID=2010828 RepID=A0A5K7SAB9_9BACT|nr:regulatory protein RecX [Aquipluma nitroreducens]BBE18528.1 regulatory protein [Aquipluma nitroreducens]
MELNQDQKIAYDKAAFLCSRSEHCSSEIQEKLKVWGLPAEDSEPVIEKLIAEKYLDDERFARAYAKDKFRFNHWGKQKIAFMLRSKNIPSEITGLALEEIEDEGYLEVLRRLMTDKEKSIKAKDQYDKRNKLMRFAMGRGFESSQIYAVLKELGI